MSVLLTYNLRYSLQPEPEEQGEQQPQEAGVAPRGGAPREPPLAFRPPVHRVCAFAVRWAARARRAGLHFGGDDDGGVKRGCAPCMATAHTA